jgi:primosomal protein N' (replication factor Y)
MAPDTLVEVAAFVPVQSTLTYRVPADLSPLVRRGCRVLVPVGKRTVVGVVVSLDPPASGLSRDEIRSITDLLEVEPTVPPELLDLVLWMAGYYLALPGDAVRAALPTPLQAREREFVRLTPEGKAALAAQEALLRSPHQDLGREEVEILELLREQGGVVPLSRLKSRGRVGAVLCRLLARALVAQSSQREVPGRGRTDLLLELVEPVDAPALSRAPRQRELIEALQARGGKARLSQLHRPISDARTVARKLAARGLMRVQVLEVPRDPFAAEPVEVDRPPQLTEEQSAALRVLLEANRTEGFAAFLLHGVTGSGKTEVYLRLIAQNLERGRGALVLVPEISLTPQLAARFRARFGNQVAVLHSGLTEAERFGQWRLIHSGQVAIVVGARSAIFAPLARVGVVIVDEEHDPSFKQAEGVRYHARDLALVRAKQAGAVAVLGSATPSLESYHGVEQGRLRLLRLDHRATASPLPEVQIVDLRVHRPGPEGALSAPLAEALQTTLDRGEQAILFLNRRGYSTFVLCRGCGYAFRCDHCSVTLTYHRSLQRLVCHYCGFATAVPVVCPTCGSDRIALLGLGTEQVELFLRERFPGARVGRLDRDTATGRGVRNILGQLGRREIDILVGTQMVTKGHDFPYVTLVGVVCADLGLHFPDFRSAERTFQLLTQVAGRAGRGDRPGRVVIQTYSPDHPSVVAASAHDYQSFYRAELPARRELGYPPFAYLAAVRMDGPDAGAVAGVAQRLAERGRTLLGRTTEVTLLGPAEAPIQKLKGKTRWLLLVKAGSRASLRRVLDSLVTERADGPRGSGRVRVSVDVDPVFML